MFTESQGILTALEDSLRTCSKRQIVFISGFPNNTISPWLLTSLGSRFALTSLIAGQCLTDHLRLPWVVVPLTGHPDLKAGPIVIGLRVNSLHMYQV